MAWKETEQNNGSTMEEWLYDLRSAQSRVVDSFTGRFLQAISVAISHIIVFVGVNADRTVLFLLDTHQRIERKGKSKPNSSRPVKVITC